MHFFSTNGKFSYFNLSLNKVIIDNVSIFNYLGIMIDEHLSWNSHNEMIGIKVSKAVGIINHLKFKYSQRVLTTLLNFFNYLLCYPRHNYYYGANQIMLTKLLNYKR